MTAQSVQHGLCLSSPAAVALDPSSCSKLYPRVYSFNFEGHFAKVEMQIISLSRRDLKKTFGQKEREKRDRKKNTSLTPDVCRWALWNEEHLQRGLKSSASVSYSYPPKSSVLFTLCPLQVCQREFQLCLKCMRLSVLSRHLLLKPSYSYLITEKWNLWRYIFPHRAAALCIDE